MSASHWCGAPPSLDMLVEAWQTAWRKRQATVGLSKTALKPELHHAARRMLLAFRARGLARPAGRIICVEEEYRGPAAPTLPDLLARLDLVVEEDERLVVPDFKTARSRWSPEQAEEEAGQLLLYSELARHLAPGKPVHLEFVVITKTKVPAVDRHLVAADRQHVERAIRIAQRIWRAIEAGHFFPAPSPIHCSTCPFQAPCRAWTG